MKPKIRSFAADATVSQVSDELLDNGCVIVEARCDKSTMDALHHELQPYLDSAPTGKTDFAGHQSRRRNNLLRKSKTCQTMAIDSLVVGVSEKILGPYCARIRLHVTALIELFAGEVRQGIHRDGSLYPVRHPAPPMTLAAFWAYTDFTEENGATLVAPGSHMWAHEREPNDDELVHAVMPRGSVLLYTSSVWHGSGANRSNGVRTGMALHYNLGWLRQEENQLLSAPPAIAKEFPPTLQRLIGYDFGGPYLGFVEEGNPKLLLEDDVIADYARTDPQVDALRGSVEPIAFGDLYKHQR